jgi:serine/threonine protein kinase
MSATLSKNTEHYIGRFRVLQVLGRGSEGVVYLANDPKLGREVAIKTTSLGASPDPLLADLLVSTAQTASKLSHPNIVPVFEAGMHEGSPYVVFEYVEGSTLEQRLAINGPMPVARAVVMMSQILSGLAQIHERSLIHGDIKPANILVGADERARVADFGLLRHERATDFDQSSGTLRYMAPECFAAGSTDCRRDVFALGLVFFEMLTGAPVIARGSTPAQVIELLKKPLAPPSSKNPRVPPEIDAIVMKALECNLERRFASAGQMKRELDRIRVPAGAREGVDLSENTVHATVEFLLRRMAHKSDFPALSSSLACINQLSGQGDDLSIKALSDTVMRDFALTQKLLRLVNSAGMGAGKVTKVSAAITILGFSQLRAVAAAMMLAGGGGGKRSPAISAALTDTFVAGLISRNVGRMTGLAAVEELFICGMFSLLGELLALFYLADEHGEIARRVDEDDVRVDAAARAVLGLSYEELGAGVARHWQFPPAIIEALAPLPPGKLAPAPADRMWQCAAYARELCGLARIPDAAAREAALAGHIKRFAPAIRIDAATVRELMTRSVEVAGNYISAAGLTVSKTPLLEGMRALSAAPSDTAAAPAVLTPTTMPPAAAADATLVIAAAPAPAAGWRAKLSNALKSVF